MRQLFKLSGVAHKLRRNLAHQQAPLSRQYQGCRAVEARWFCNAATPRLTPIHEIEEVMRRFLEACRRPAIRRTMSIADLERGALTELVNGSTGSASIIEVGILHEDKNTPVLKARFHADAWPMASAAKNDGGIGPEIYFQRVGAPYRGCFSDCLKILRNGETVGIVGTSGIGKSAAVNGYLEQLLRHLGEDDWPSVVALRVDACLTTFTHVPSGAPNVTVEEIKFEDLRSVARRLAKVGGVLLVELDEGDTHLQTSCGTLMTMSNRNVITDFKALDKTPSHSWRLADPWSVAELEAAARVMFATKAWRPKPTLAETLLLVRERCEAVGPLIRFVICRAAKFKAREDVQKGIKPRLLFDYTMSENSVFAVDAYWKYYLAAFIKPGVTVPTTLSSDWYWDFLSNSRRSHAVRLADTLPDAVARISDLGIKFLLSEAIVKCALLDDEGLPQKFRLSEWEWFKDPGAKKLRNADILPGAPENLKLCREWNFIGRYATFDLTKVPPTVLCSSTGWQSVLCESFAVDNAKKVVYLFQVTDVLPQNRVKKPNPSKIKQVEKFRKEGHLPDDYTFSHVYIMDMNKNTMVQNVKSGAGLEDDHGGTIYMIDSEHFSDCYFVRAPLSPGVPPVRSSTPPSA